MRPPGADPGASSSSVRGDMAFGLARGAAAQAVYLAGVASLGQALDERQAPGCEVVLSDGRSR
eukprot:2019841-Pyramimonas_sp.AAC.1